MSQTIKLRDRVRIHLDSRFGTNQGWYEGTVFSIEPYSEHRSFYWVELDKTAQEKLGLRQISVLNPKNIEKIESTG